MSKSTERITQINENDIICGRRGLSLKHPGNLAYRKIVGLNKKLYATCLKNEKLRVSKSIVAATREVGGRFVEREDRKSSTSLDEQDENGNPVVWRDIGDKRAVEKTSQALREGQPKLLKKLAQKQGHDVAPPQAHRHHAAAMNPSLMTNYCYSSYVPQIVKPPPTSVLSHILQQCDTDLLLLALLVDKANGR
eukprot:CAMPEP_0201866414 /NCGR_PEP_ID=MMETSP0902-20130614/1017_1 /ASSEMBLY_ACC=CAM_ASM_000551 /TAXON_ID=420261 /ORGANISM="Thalassiosira antarctica, Strain CCMP982" /LENGTH=192 /DNA_ID=CAMNT_0048391387 /DNA_START=118 /DNA_END=696 /DNA_ORIENTATION=+